MTVELVSMIFLGARTRVAPRMKRRLVRVEAHLRAEHAALGTTESFASWHGVKSVAGHREGRNKHGEGLAIDVDYETDPYIATRTGEDFGGEAAAAKLDVRRAAVEACDRACGGPGLADLSARRRGETSAAVYDRFEAVSAALRGRFAPYFDTQRTRIKRRPVKRGSPRAAYEALVATGELVVPLADVPIDVLEDYEAVRIPMVFGTPSRSPKETRNPARGFMSLTRHVYIALCDVGGLRDGLAGFGLESGDVMHFDC